MTRAELEAEVWRSLTAGLGHRERGVDPRTVDAILTAADSYAVHVSGPNTPEATTGRRAELHCETCPARREP